MKMKTKINILFYTIVILCSCVKSDPLGYSEPKSSIYFNLLGTKVESFSTTLDSTMVIHFPVKCSGLPSASDRKIKVSVVNQESTAVSGEDYLPIQKEYIFPKDSFTYNLPITVIKTRKLDTLELQLTIKIEETDDFEYGDKFRLKASVKFSNKIVKPILWDGFAFYLKAYSKVKYIILLQLTNRQTFPTITEWFADRNYWQSVVPKALSGYFLDNYPVYDENGIIIQPW
jgi:hypothetical protein